MSKKVLTVCDVSVAHSSNAFVQCLKPGGTAYVAAKTYYFGVGGGSLAFKHQVEEQVPVVMGVQVVAAVDDGLSNKREILELKYV